MILPETRPETGPQGSVWSVRQVAGGAIAGSGRVYRLDPHSLPVRGFALGGTADPAFTIDRGRAVVRRPSGDPVSVPVSDYRGVAVRMESSGDNGEVRAFVELLHADPSLTLKLAVTDDPYEIAADWQTWARTLSLPLLVVGQDGSVGAPLAGMGGIIAAKPKPRRRHSFFADRRPRFLVRRKTGTLDVSLRIAGREIIARD
jgi:hypothetical protein